MSTRILAEGFVAPGLKDFDFPPIFGEGTFLTKPMLIALVGPLLIGLFLYAAARKRSTVPGKLQFAGESAYNFVRNGIAGEALGPQGKKFIPYLTALFFFIAVLNIAGIIPFSQFPATSKIAFPLFLAVISWAIFNVVGIRRQGLGGYFKNMMFPPGIPKLIYVLLAPLEFFSTVVVRPITLTLRLTLNMFAGHLVLLLCILGGEYLLLHGGAFGAVGSIVPFLGGIVLTFFEGFVQILQAYVFTLLSALYIAGAMEAEH